MHTTDDDKWKPAFFGGDSWMGAMLGPIPGREVLVFKRHSQWTLCLQENKDVSVITNGSDRPKVQWFLQNWGESYI